MWRGKKIKINPCNAQTIETSYLRTLQVSHIVEDKGTP